MRRDLSLPAYAPSPCTACIFIGTSRGFAWRDGDATGRTPGTDVYLCPAHVTFVAVVRADVPNPTPMDALTATLRDRALVLRAPDGDRIEEAVRPLTLIGPDLAEALARAVEGDLDRIYAVDEDAEDEDDG